MTPEHPGAATPPTFPPYVDVELTAKDLTALKSQARKRPYLARRWWLTLALMPALFVGTGALLSLVPEEPLGWFMMVFAFLMLPAIALLLNERWLVRAQLEWHGPFRLWITHDGLHDVGPRAHTFYPWAGIQEVRAGRKHVFIWISFMHAIVVPDRCFASTEHQRWFTETLRAGIPASTW